MKVFFYVSHVNTVAKIILECKNALQCLLAICLHIENDQPLEQVYCI